MNDQLVADKVLPTDAGGIPRSSGENDIEKNAGARFHAHEARSDAETKSVESEQFQNGVQRVRAITEVWDKKTLIIMFVLYVASSSSLFRTDTLRDTD
jgi:hypothetical protein